MRLFVVVALAGRRKQQAGYDPNAGGDADDLPGIFMDVVVGRACGAPRFVGDHSLNLAPAKFALPNSFLNLFGDTFQLVCSLILRAIRVHIIISVNSNTSKQMQSKAEIGLAPEKPSGQILIQVAKL